MEAKWRMNDRYRILREIGRGAMGTVYEAFDTAGGERVAVKILRNTLHANPVARQRFRREVEAASRVNHPVIIKIRGWGEDEDAAYIVMEYVDGQPLSKLLSPIAQFPLTTTVRIVHQVADGLASVHRAGLVHRDVKPDNIMVLKDMAVKLSDFGVAKLPNSSLTQAGEIWGTLHYMSPEQVQGSLDVDAKSDIFSLGVVLFEMLTCRRPFDGDGLGAALIRRIVENPAPRPSALKPGVPEEFDFIVARALAKDPADRFVSCDEFAQALRNALPHLRRE
jgi:eukaryotic-like serine/threonine-protein kinase